MSNSQPAGVRVPTNVCLRQSTAITIEHEQSELLGSVDLHDELSELLLSAYRFAYQLTMDRHRAEDLAQEAILRAVKGDMLSMQSGVRLWVFRVIKNLWIDELRSKRPTPSSIESSNEPPSNARPVFDQIELQEQIMIAMHAMEKLPDRQRMVLYLVACEQLSLHQISQVLDISTDAVKSSLSVARSTMRSWCLPNKEVCEETLSNATSMPDGDH